MRPAAAASALAGMRLGQGSESAYRSACIQSSLISICLASLQEEFGYLGGGAKLRVVAGHLGQGVWCSRSAWESSAAIQIRDAVQAGGLTPLL